MMGFYSSLIGPEAIQAARAHALADYPNEACGVVIGGAYIACANVHETPAERFRIDTKEWARLTKRGKITLVVHSHPDGPLFPSEADMTGQINTNIPWAIIPTDGERTGEPIIWGDGAPVAPLIGRPFTHGVFDCYSLVRDIYRTGKEELARLEISNSWPHEPIVMPEIPRDDCWWNKGLDLYVDHLEPEGFKRISISDARPGDGFLTSIKSDKLNHAGVLIDHDMIMHHLPGRLSRREPASLWGRQAALWVRYVGKGGANA